MKKTIKLKAKCQTFDIEVEAKINTRGLVADEIERVEKSLKHKLSNALASLPFAHIYPYEVNVR